MTPVIFDLDGTLVDSVPDLQAALNRAFAAEGVAPFDLPTVTSFIGKGMANLVQRGIEARGLDAAAHPRLFQATAAAYEAEPTLRTRLYPGVTEALAALAQAGHPLGICTNKPEGAARLVLDQMGLTPWFQSIVGGGRVALKPDPAPLRLCMAELGADHAIFVGDSEVDADTALAADLPFLLYTEGYRKSPAQDLPQTARFSDFAELPWLVAEQG
ncbi:phosphoglycolate phosphatase [Xinfangfangia sp. D13-10-4-6]|uniref:phosphoglycolate phosphatase n=1 Tax=Pseudogemmobacter hezensis TaxID=2737662 RepID=UPI00155358E2|nr:phosphoglycolate phosphatase [Pseudogemmobacter hezensis]NPD14396.1 phosphoglycolate phosphatase [Pseudogemmobacter hezensis]